MSHLQALQETDPSLSMFTMHSGIPNAYNRWQNYWKTACVCIYNIYAMDNGLQVKYNKKQQKQVVLYGSMGSILCNKLWCFDWYFILCV